MNQLIDQAAHVLHNGGVVLHATEGVWGFACDPDCESAVQRILQIKGRDAGKGLIVIGADEAAFESELGSLRPDHAQQVRSSWPGAHTWIMPNKRFSSQITGGRDTVACRVPGHAQARRLCATFGGVLVSTSANRSGAVAATTQAQAQSQFEDEVDCVLPGEVDVPGRPSTIHGPDGSIVR